MHMRQHTSEYVELVHGRQAEGHAAFGSLQGCTSAPEDIYELIYFQSAMMLRWTHT
jgi:hypothetical protein